MLNYIWGFMILFGLCICTINGSFEAVSNNLLSSAKEAIDLLIVMLGAISMWSGFLSIAEGSGLTQKLSLKMQPFIHFMFPNIPKNHPASFHICTNFIANILGLGWAATPTGIAAIKSLHALSNEQNLNSSFASNEMCTFLILNISSLQIIPMNMIAYRSQYGSPNPLSIICPALIATSLTTFFSICLCKILTKRKEAV